MIEPIHSLNLYVCRYHVEAICGEIRRNRRDVHLHQHHTLGMMTIDCAVNVESHLEIGEAMGKAMLNFMK